ncbi:DUF7693 family protein [Dongia sp. agr-C8]
MSDEDPSISMTEMADVLRRAARGEIPVTVDFPYVPNERSSADFHAEGFTISIYDDAGCLDYVDWTVAPDGRRCTFDDWRRAAEKAKLEAGNPLDLLSEDEQQALETILVAAPSQEIKVSTEEETTRAGGHIGLVYSRFDWIVIALASLGLAILLSNFDFGM